MFKYLQISKVAPFVVIALVVVAAVGIVHAQATTQPPIGYLDSVTNCRIIQGWSCDLDTVNQPTDIHLYYDGPAGSGKLLGVVKADKPRDPGVAAACGGNANHGFAVTVPAALQDGKPHPIYTYAINTNGPNHTHLSGSPRTITCSQPTNVVPIGNLDAASCSAISGWACDQDVPNQAIDVHILKDGQAGDPKASYVGVAKADQPREAAIGTLCGGNKAHGFSLAVPDSLKDGKPHTIYPYGIDTAQKGNPLLSNYGLSITCVKPSPSPSPSPSNQPIDVAPIGNLDNASCLAISGWSCDKDTVNQPTDVHLYDGPAGVGKLLAVVKADKPRDPGVAAACGGNANHGFAFTTPDSIKDGKAHAIYAYGINTGGANNSHLTSSPLSLTCAKPSPSPSPTGANLYVTAISGPNIIVNQKTEIAAYVIMTLNTGPETAHQVKIQYTRPAGMLLFGAFKTNGSQGYCYDIGDNMVECQQIDNPPNTIGRLTLLFKPAISQSDCGSFTSLQATVSSAEINPLPQNNASVKIFPFLACDGNSSPPPLQTPACLSL